TLRYTRRMTDPTSAADDVADLRLTLPDGRTLAYTLCGIEGGQPLLRIPGTPGCRWSIRSDRSLWLARNLRAITTERPGFGASTRLPGRGFAEHSDDLARLLDHLGLERVHVIGGSGAGPHIVSLCGRHPDRVRAATVLVGITPLQEREIDAMIPVNAATWRAVAAGDRAAAEAVIRPVWEVMVHDPLSAFEGIMASAPPDDLEILHDPAFLSGFERASREAVAVGIDGWIDENFAIAGDWADVDPAAVACSLTWYHAAGDRNCPITAAQRLVAQIPGARFVEWPTEVGHFHGFRHEGEILDELLARG
ncbi:MAG: alpha/beta hydrolase, partial [Nocardioides sp.]